LAAVPEDAEVIVVHDAARPLAGRELFTSAIAALSEGIDGAVCAVPVTDTIRSIDDGTIDRSVLVAVQTPQAFRAKALREAHGNGAEATDDASLIDAAGGTVVLVAGDRWNVKITDRNDLAVAEALVRT
jgi:2-C-methyl-D-erythritol 4-phosphate cytidylyltransferase